MKKYLASIYYTDVDGKEQCQKAVVYAEDETGVMEATEAAIEVVSEFARFKRFEGAIAEPMTDKRSFAELDTVVDEIIDRNPEFVATINAMIDAATATRH